MADFDRRELLKDLGPLLRATQKGLQATMWTALPGTVISFNREHMTCQVQPAIKAQVLSSTGALSWMQLPVLVDCPVVFPSGGGFALTFPIAAGDECLVVFSSRCIDSWWQSGGVQVQAELRMHDLSDGFVLPGVRSQPRVLPAISATDVQLRNDDGSTFISIGTDDLVTIQAENLIARIENAATVAASQINLTGNVTITGNATVTGELTIAGTLIAEDFGTTTVPSFNGHVHPGIRGGTDTSLPPLAGT